MVELKHASSMLRGKIKTSVKKEVTKLNDDLEALGVIDTGLFEASFNLFDAESFKFYELRITNSAESITGFKYPAVLAKGRHIKSDGRMGGSLKWKLGLAPMVIDLRDRIERIKI